MPLRTHAERIGLPDALVASAALDGLLLLAVVDPHTGTVLVSHRPGAGGDEGPDAAFAAAGAADLVRSLRLMSARVSPRSEVGDVVVTLTDHHYLLRPVRIDGGETVAVLLVLSRPDTNLAMALRVLRRLPGVLPEVAAHPSDLAPRARS